MVDEVILPSSIDTIAIIQENSNENIAIIGSPISESIVSASSQENYTIGQIVPDGTTIVCCDTQDGQDATATAVKLVLTKTASENISALKLIYLDTDTTCALADNVLSSTSFVEGVSTNGGIAGAPIEIIVFGILEDPSFSYAINEMLFLGVAGNITNVEPSSGFLTRIGYGLGAGAIKVSIEKPITL